ncbi:MAG: hypothetical protein IJJ76_04560 [Ruminococcus sp.]|uniref:hypothetical protein n=1 Tax=Ruminococcus sp. TaxID=41978 RepID=UPI0025E8E123|nr:hypothetical protein [Ruminococcus sp.]MBR0529019.1 hypothetical protein [Ruminococcus sp.]
MTDREKKIERLAKRRDKNRERMLRTQELDEKLNEELIVEGGKNMAAQTNLDVLQWSTIIERYNLIERLLNAGITLEMLEGLVNGEYSLKPKKQEDENEKRIF